MAEFINKKINLVYVSFKGRRHGFLKLALLLKLLRLIDDTLIVENYDVKHSASDNKETILGSNILNDYSAYKEGAEELVQNGKAQRYLLLVNDTFATHRHFGVTSYLSLIFCLLYIKYTDNKNILIGETSGNGMQEKIYSRNIQKTFSSYLMIVTHECFSSFIDEYYQMVTQDIIYDGKIIKSMTNNISNNYMMYINSYLGIECSTYEDRWYLASESNIELKLKKAKTLILERLLPTYIIESGGVVKDLYPSSLLKKIAALEGRLVRLLK